MNFKKRIASLISRKVKMSGVFDPNYYNTVYPDISKNKIDPIKHYLDHGLKEGRHPNALFDPRFYSEKYLNEKEDQDPLLHYLSKKGRKNSPHPLFDVDFYLSQLGDHAEKIKTTYLEHFLSIGWKQGFYPTPFFDPEFYLSNNEDVARENVNPLIHYLTFGEKEGRVPSPFFEPSLYQKPKIEKNTNYAVYLAKSKLEYYALGVLHTNSDFSEFVRRSTQLEIDRPIVIYVSHEGSRTGAPLIILELAKRLKMGNGLNPISILLRGGEISPEFDVLGPSYVSNYYGSSHQKFLAEIESILSRINKKNLVCAIVNSAESRAILPSLKKLDIPVISLIHEMASFYPENSWKGLNDYSDVIIFPSQIVKDQALENSTFKLEKLKVRGQGLLNEKFLNYDKIQARSEISHQFEGIDENTIIVLGCGTTIPRKGIDYFTHIGITYFLNKVDDKDVKFIWLGQLVENEQLEWCIREIKLSGFEDHILFVGATNNPIPFFNGSDIFLMTSKADPFPCVVHEAMASRLPILCFEGGGGYIEALEDNAGIVLPFGDFVGLNNKLTELIVNDQYRKELGENARNRVLSHYDFNDYALFIADLIYKTADFDKRNLFSKQSFANNSISMINQSRNKPVIFTLPDWGISGVNTLVEILVLDLIDRGYDAYILFTRNFSLEAEGVSPRVPYRFLNPKGDGFRGIWKSLKIYLELSAPCIFVPNYDYIASALSPDLSNDVGILGVLHSDDLEHYEHGYRLGRYWNQTISVSQLIHDKMVDLNPAMQNRLSVVYNGVERPVSEIHEIQKFPTFSMIYTGRIVQYQKRVLDFIKIIEKFEKVYPNFLFTFVGEGSELMALENGLKTFIESGKVRLLGRLDRSRIYEELSQSHVFTLFSDFEGLPVSLLEAISLGCVPVLTNIQSGIQEIIQDRVNGLISPIGDVDKFVENLLLLASNSDLWQRLSNEAFLTIEKYELTTQAMGKKYNGIIKEIFEEIEQGLFERPKALTFGSSFGDILIPPMYQDIKDN